MTTPQLPPPPRQQAGGLLRGGRGRGYADRDAIAVQDALAGLDAGAWMEIHAVLSGLLRSTVSITEVAGERWTAGQLVEHANEVVAAAPPHYEFAIAEAARAWARGGPSVAERRCRVGIPWWLCT
ncbi:hypothetical protein [Streptomyces sp. NPDC057460]|uniref:hypothetical protein n=1 Tax=Streptomyces sp. NPDC057460 TaxID=3346141 RepID=UPI003678F133